MRGRIWILAAGLALVTAGLVTLTRPGVKAEPPGGAPGLEGPSLWIRVAWGNEGPDLGRLDGQEAASEGPMSFTVTPFGELYVLDQVNRRVVRYGEGGALDAEIPLPAPTYQDLAVSPDGVVLALDRLARRSLLLLEEDGRMVDEVPVEGPGVPEGGAITALLLQEDGVWLEVAHSFRVRVLDPWLLPCKRTVREGRWAGDPAVVAQAALDGRGGAALWLADADDGTIYGQRLLGFEHDVARIAWLETAETGHLLLALHLWTWRADDPRLVAHEENRLILYDQYLNRVAEASSPHVIGRWEQFRELKVSGDGHLYQMAFDEAGVSFLRWRMP